MTQQTMFDDFDKQRMVQPDRPIKPPHNGTETSKAAAEAIAGKSGTKRRMVYDYVKQCGEHGATRGEIHKALGVKESTVCGRVSELLLDGLLIGDGERPNEDNNSCEVLKAIQ